MMRRFVLLCAAALTCGVSAAELRLLDSDGRPIDRIEIDGNRHISDFEIRNALGLGPADAKTAIDVMKSVLPYFSEVNWRVEDRDGQHILTISVREKGLWNRRGELTGGFNRATGFRLGPRWAIERRPDLRTEPRGEIFGELSYAFGSDAWHPRVGASVKRGSARRGTLSFSGQFHRIPEVRDPDELPNDGEQFVLALLYGTDVRDYYEREGAELRAAWESETKRHRVSAAFVDEAHRSIPISTRWNLFRPTALPEPNLPASPGTMKSVTLRYEHDRRSDPVFTTGWYGSVELEQGVAAFGSDFDFARLIGRFHRHFRIGDDYLLFRLKTQWATDDLPIQRQFILGGMGTLRGFEENEYFGSAGVLTNAEYRKHFFGSTFLLAVVDVGETWSRGGSFDPARLKASAGVGFMFENGPRVYVSQALESDRTPRAQFRWARMF